MQRRTFLVSAAAGALGVSAGRAVSAATHSHADHDHGQVGESSATSLAEVLHDDGQLLVVSTASGEEMPVVPTDYPDGVRPVPGERVIVDLEQRLAWPLVSTISIRTDDVDLPPGEYVRSGERFEVTDRTVRSRASAGKSGPVAFVTAATSATSQRALALRASS